MSTSKIISKSGRKITLSLEIELDSNSMLKSEEQIAKALNEAGVLATEEALKQFDTQGSPIEKNGKVYTSKGKQKKNINFRMAQKK
ncbi:MAG: hypothetical protein AAF849_23885 [Bacteroidota bacterium]